MAAFFNTRSLDDGIYKFNFVLFAF